MTSLRTSFQLQRAEQVLSKIQSFATAAALVTRITPLSVFGLLVHVAGFAVAMTKRDLSDIAAMWHGVTLDPEVQKIAQQTLVPFQVQRTDHWMHCDIGEQHVLAYVGNGLGSLHAEKDPASLIKFIREGLWSHYGNHVSLAPGDRWSDSIGLRATEPAPAPDSRRAREVWARVEPYIVQGKPRSVLLDGPPGSGKSTMTRRLLDLTEGVLGRPIRVVRIPVADFAYLRPSSADAALRLLQPDAVVIDDFDRMLGSDSLLDFLEHARRRSRIMIGTCNDSSKLSLAVRRPERFDRREMVEGVGDELAAKIFGARWAELPADLQAQIARWPAAFVSALVETLEVEPGVDLTTEVASLQERISEPPKTASPPPAATPAPAAVAS